MGELRRERRTAIILGVVGVTIFAGLIALFVMSREQDVPTMSSTSAAPVSAAEMAGFIADFAVKGNRFFNGKILPVAVSVP